MQYPFLKKNELILIDFMPGSSGQLLLRLWSELDSKLDYDNPEIMSTLNIPADPVSREIDYDIVIPKTTFNWFIDQNQPDCKQDYVTFFEMLATYLLAAKQKWANVNSGIKFYQDRDYDLVGHRVTYAIHSRTKHIPIDQIRDSGYNVRMFRIVPQTYRGRLYQYHRYLACYPTDTDWSTKDRIRRWNSKSNNDVFDLCTLLVDRDSDAILTWLREKIGDSIRIDKLDRAAEILDEYYAVILDNMGL